MPAPRVGARVSVLTAAAVLVALAGCAGPTVSGPATPTRTATATPSARSTPAPDRARIVVDGTGIRVYGDDGGVDLDLPFSTEVAVAVESLTSALGEPPQTTTVFTDRCYQQLEESSWGGLHLYSSPDGLIRPGGARFYVQVQAAEATAGLPIQLPSGQSVGASRGQVLSANTGAPSFSDGNTISLHYDIEQGSADGDPSQYWGALAQIVSGKLALIDAPVYYSRPC